MKTIIFIHGNSCSSKAFHDKLGWLKRLFKCVFVDLPGHGTSADLTNVNDYSFRGYAKWVLSFVKSKGINNAIICGWSLGGHVAIEMAALDPNFVTGLILTGTPPIPLTPKGFIDGFCPLTKIVGSDGKNLSSMMGQIEQFDENDAKVFVKAAGLPLKHKFVEDAIRTDGNARYNMIKSCINGEGGCDEKKFIEETKIPVCFIAGRGDHGINIKYIRSLKLQKCFGIYEIKGGHACFWDSPDVFGRIIIDFCDNL